jgi:Ca-activated chloride channel family protein
MRFEAYEWLTWVWAVAALAVVSAVGIVRGRGALSRFVEAGLLPVVAGGAAVFRRWLKAALATLALGLVIVALARPQWGASPQELRQSGRDVCFVIDVSKSMLAEDVAPNRLERAKILVRDAMEAARGDRVAIVAFAGTAVVKCPLTLDYGFARAALDDLSPMSVARGGTLIGDAIRRTLEEVFEDDEATFKDVILITDGEDQESFPVQAAERAGEAGVRIIAIGLGDENVGRPIPVTDPTTGEKRLAQYNGETVLSRLDATTLREVAAASRGGAYYNVATGTIELDSVYRQLIRSAQQRSTEEVQKVQYEERFQIFLAAALALLVVERLVSERRRLA